MLSFLLMDQTRVPIRRNEMKILKLCLSLTHSELVPRFQKVQMIGVFISYTRLEIVPAIINRMKAPEPANTCRVKFLTF